MSPADAELMRRHLAADRSPWIWVQYDVELGAERYHVYCYPHVPVALRDSQPRGFPMNIDPNENRLKCWGCQTEGEEAYPRPL